MPRISSAMNIPRLNTVPRAPGSLRCWHFCLGLLAPGPATFLLRCVRSPRCRRRTRAPILRFSRPKSFQFHHLKLLAMLVCGTIFAGLTMRSLRRAWFEEQRCPRKIAWLLSTVSRRFTQETIVVTLNASRYTSLHSAGNYFPFERSKYNEAEFDCTKQSVSCLVFDVVVESCNTIHVGIASTISNQTV